MAVSSTTKMMNLLTLVLVTLPGLTLSFTNKRAQSELQNYLRELFRAKSGQRVRTTVTGSLGEDIGVCCNMKKRSGARTENLLPFSGLEDAPPNDPLKDLYEELQLGVAPPSPARGPDYVCCNQPGTRPPRPRLPHFRSLILSLQKRDDTDALLREAMRVASRRLSEANGPRGYYQSAEAPLRDSLLSEILRLDRRGGGSGLTTYDGSAMADKRGRGGGRVPGGPNEPWHFSPQQQKVSRRFANR